MGLGFPGDNVSSLTPLMVLTQIYGYDELQMLQSRLPVVSGKCREGEALLSAWIPPCLALRILSLKLRNLLPFVVVPGAAIARAHACPLLIPRELKDHWDLGVGSAPTKFSSFTWDTRHGVVCLSLEFL